MPTQVQWLHLCPLQQIWSKLKCPRHVFTTWNTHIYPYAFHSWGQFEYCKKQCILKKTKTFTPSKQQKRFEYPSSAPPPSQWHTVCFNAWNKQVSNTILLGRRAIITSSHAPRAIYFSCMYVRVESTLPVCKILDYVLPLNQHVARGKREVCPLT